MSNPYATYKYRQAGLAGTAYGGPGTSVSAQQAAGHLVGNARLMNILPTKAGFRQDTKAVRLQLLLQGGYWRDPRTLTPITQDLLDNWPTDIATDVYQVAGAASLSQIMASIVSHGYTKIGIKTFGYEKVRNYSATLDNVNRNSVHTRLARPADGEQIPDGEADIVTGPNNQADRTRSVGGNLLISYGRYITQGGAITRSKKGNVEYLGSRPNRSRKVEGSKSLLLSCNLDTATMLLVCQTVFENARLSQGWGANCSLTVTDEEDYRTYELKQIKSLISAGRKALGWSGQGRARPTEIGPTYANALIAGASQRALLINPDTRAALYTRLIGEKIGQESMADWVAQRRRKYDVYVQRVAASRAKAYQSLGKDVPEWQGFPVDSTFNEFYPTRNPEEEAEERVTRSFYGGPGAGPTPNAPSPWNSAEFAENLGGYNPGAGNPGPEQPEEMQQEPVPPPAAFQAPPAPQPPAPQPPAAEQPVPQPEPNVIPPNVDVVMDDVEPPPDVNVPAPDQVPVPPAQPQTYAEIRRQMVANWGGTPDVPINNTVLGRNTQVPHVFPPKGQVAFPGAVNDGNFQRSKINFGNTFTQARRDAGRELVDTSAYYNKIILGLTSMGQQDGGTVYQHFAGTIMGITTNPAQRALVTNVVRRMIPLAGMSQDPKQYNSYIGNLCRAIGDSDAALNSLLFDISPSLVKIANLEGRNEDPNWIFGAIGSVAASMGFQRALEVGRAWADLMVTPLADMYNFIYENNVAAQLAVKWIAGTRAGADYTGTPATGMTRRLGATIARSEELNDIMGMLNQWATDQFVTNAQSDATLRIVAALPGNNAVGRVFKAAVAFLFGGIQPNAFSAPNQLLVNDPEARDIDPARVSGTARAYKGELFTEACPVTMMQYTIDNGALIAGQLGNEAYMYNLYHQGEDPLDLSIQKIGNWAVSMSSWILSATIIWHQLLSVSADIAQWTANGIISLRHLTEPVPEPSSVDFTTEMWSGIQAYVNTWLILTYWVTAGPFQNFSRDMAPLLPQNISNYIYQPPPDQPNFQFGGVGLPSVFDIGWQSMEITYFDTISNRLNTDAKRNAGYGNKTLGSLFDQRLPQAPGRPQNA